MENYTYPHVSMNTTALKRSSVGPAVEDTTVLFAPIMAKRGPTDRIVVCHTLSEFIDTFGDLNYKENKLQAFNVYNWLSNGGTVYAKRLMFPANSRAQAVNGDNVTWRAKYPGEWYNHVTISIVARAQLTGYSDVTIKHTENGKTVVLESFYRVKNDNFKSTLDGSRYIEVGDVTELQAAEITLAGGSDGTSQTLKTLDDLVAAYFNSTKDTGEFVVGSAEEDLGNKLETPIDMIMDACFSAKTKEAILKFTTGIDSLAGTSGAVGPLDSAVRPDIITILEEAIIDDESISSTTIGANATNLGVYTQNFTIYDAIFSDMNVTVGPTYFLSKLIPFNDLQYGIQFPTAGLRRGVLADALSVNRNPRPQEKETLFRSRINYVEKTSREYAFMSQRTHDGSTEAEYTALSFLNNSRCLEKMKKELEKIGREYLFEFNDSVTLSQLSNILNKYMGNWVANRTLNYAVVDVRQNEYSSEKVDIFLNVRFTGTIEIIAVDITIE